MNLYTTPATPDQRWKMFLPTVAPIEGNNSLDAIAASACLRNRWIASASQPAHSGAPFFGSSIDSSRIIQNSAYAQNISASTASRLWTVVGERGTTMSAHVLFAIVAVLGFGILLVLALCNLLLSIKDDSSTWSSAPDDSPIHDDPNAEREAHVDAGY